MSLRIGLKLFLILLLGKWSQFVSADVYWSYADEQQWPVTNVTMCSGNQQSPIDIKTAETQSWPEAKPIEIYYGGTSQNPGSVKLTNNGHTVQVTFNAGEWYLSLDGYKDKHYELAQMHFHSPSEHKVDGVAYGLEAHIVTFNKKMYTNVGDAVKSPGGLAVVGILHQVNNATQVSDTQMPLYGNMSDHLNALLQEVNISTIAMDKILSLTGTTHYYRYSGSLTTPPCTENVIWTIMRKPVTLTSDQLSLFNSVSSLRNTIRSVQPLNGDNQTLPRIVYRAAGIQLTINSFNYLCTMTIIFHFMLRA